MLRLFTLLAAIASLLAGAFAVTASAATPNSWLAYDTESFAAAQASGKTLVVDVHAGWCPTCRAQAPILDELRGENKDANVIFVRVDFDKDKAFLRAHRIPRQSTIVVFKGTKEVARSIAETDRQRLRSVVLGAI